MSFETAQWLKAFHILGFMAWTATLTSALHTMRAHTNDGGGGSQAFIKLEKLTGKAMDASALIAISCGVALLSRDFSGYMGHGFMHMKLAAVVGLIVVHVLTRIRIRKIRNGDETPLKPVLISVAYALIFVIVLAVVVGPVVFKS